MYHVDDLSRGEKIDLIRKTVIVVMVSISKG